MMFIVVVEIVNGKSTLPIFAAKYYYKHYYVLVLKCKGADAHVLLFNNCSFVNQLRSPESMLKRERGGYVAVLYF